MANYYLAVTVKEDDGRCLAFVVKYNRCSNLKSVLDGIRFLLFANVYNTQKQAREAVECWNESYRHNGTYIFDCNPAVVYPEGA